MLGDCHTARQLHCSTDETGQIDGMHGSRYHAPIQTEARAGELEMMKNKPNQGARKTETLTLRLDPKIKYTIELMARIKRQSITSVIEAAIEATAFDLDTPVVVNGKREIWSLSMAVSEYWSTDVVARFINLCAFMPELLTYEEQRIWETIKITPKFWDENIESYLAPYHIKGMGYIDKFLVGSYFESLSNFVEENKDSRTVIPFDFVRRIKG